MKIILINFLFLISNKQLEKENKIKKTPLFLFLIILLLSSFLLTGCGKKQMKKTVPTPTPEGDILPTISENEFTANLVPRYDKKAVFLKINKLPLGIKNIEYELTYDTDGVERGVMGTITIDSDGPINREILLGTCSKNVCVYDKNVKKIKLVLRIETNKGLKTWSKEFSLESGE